LSSTAPAYVQLQQWWSQSGSDIDTEAIPAHRIESLERRYDLVLPDDFREYLNLSSPIEEAWDHEDTTWWHFERIKSVKDEWIHGDLEPFIAERRNKYLVFADYCIWCWAWAISCADDETRGSVAIIGGRGYDRTVAESFSDFVRKYIGDIGSVF
jgi:hypothetical protein